MEYIKIIFSDLVQDQKDRLIALLAEAGMDGFEEGHSYLVAYREAWVFNEKEIMDIATSLALPFEKEIIPETNWNTEWEKNFEPVQVEEFCIIRAEFHLPVKDVVHDIIITPKMSFGTGHHATTYMMIQWMREIDCRNKSVLDFGTGTGILAILAEKLRAQKVLAIDSDQWSIENAAENIMINNCSVIQLQKSDFVDFNEKFDIILANINKNVLIKGMLQLRQHLEKGGVLVISGLLIGDREDIIEEADRNSLVFSGESQKDGWISIQLKPLSK